MKKLILTGALGAAVLMVSACGDSDADTAPVEDAAAVDDLATADAGTATADPDWPSGTRIVQEGDAYYRVDPAGTRVVIDDGSWRIETEGDERFRVNSAGRRVLIDDDGLDVDLPGVDGVDLDVGTNDRGNLDVDLSTDGTDASSDRENDR